MSCCGEASFGSSRSQTERSAQTKRYRVLEPDDDQIHQPVFLSLNNAVARGDDTQGRDRGLVA